MRVTTPMKEEIPLDGYSGYKVVLIKSKNASIVRKQSRQAVQNVRLKAQCEKHSYFTRLESTPFCVPRVIRKGMENGLFFYEYEFIPGITLLHAIETLPLQRVRTLLDRVIHIIRYENRCDFHFESIDERVTLRNGLILKINQKLEESNLPSHIAVLMRSRMMLVSDRSERTLCHGDFTFDNIIVGNDGELWLIDFIDNFYPHYWFDASKLFQDTDGGWYELKQKRQLPHNRLAFVRLYLLDGLKNFDEHYIAHHAFFVAFALLRNLPYIEDTTLRRTIEDRIHKILVT